MKSLNLLSTRIAVATDLFPSHDENRQKPQAQLFMQDPSGHRLLLAVAEAEPGQIVITTRNDGESFVKIDGKIMKLKPVTLVLDNLDVEWENWKKANGY